MSGVVRGRLRLKKPKSAVVNPQSGGKAALKAQKTKKTKKAEVGHSDAELQQALLMHDPREAEKEAAKALLADAVPRRGTEFTDAELSFLVSQAKREQARVEKAAQKSYREKIEEMNKKLATMTEINDMPKVGPG